MKTERLKDGGLSIPTCTRLADGNRRWLEPTIVRHSILEALLSPPELESLLLVKLDRATAETENAHQLLKPSRFGDGVARYLTFSSDGNFYFADRQLKAKLDPFFTARDTACRYGSLPVSDCYKGVVAVKGLRVKVVDFKNDRDAAFESEDCHGKLSTSCFQQLQKLGLKGSANRPFQFRLAYQPESSMPHDAPNQAFLAKGTFMVDDAVMNGYDVILDRSAIKGLNSTFPCGDYVLPTATIGDRANAQHIPYRNSWQFSMWFSKEAVLADFLKPTLKLVDELTARQRDPLSLARYLVERSDQRTATLNGGSDPTDLEEGGDETRTESRMISLLRADTLGLLCKAPKVVDFLQQQTAEAWQNAAINGGYLHNSGMAMPIPKSHDLPRGVVCAPHLPEGEVIITRLPIISSDNIRRYENRHIPKLSQYKGCVWVHPQDWQEHHQGDFDGDQVVVDSARHLPHIAKETLRAGESGRFPPIAKRDKVPYTAVRDQQGDYVYDTLSKVAVAAYCNNDIGRVATAIGRVHTALPTVEQAASTAGLKLFGRQQQQLLMDLMGALQVAVDGPKSAERVEDVYPNLLKDVRSWATEHPSPFFDYYKHPNLYRTFALPTGVAGQSETPAVSALAEAVNGRWESVKLQAYTREHFRGLFGDTRGVDVNILDYAEELKARLNRDMGELREQTGENDQSFKEAISILYDSYRAEIHEMFETETEKEQVALAIWDIAHRRDDLTRERQASLEVAEGLPVLFEQGSYELPGVPFELDAHILTVPFDRAESWCDRLDGWEVYYDAVIPRDLPVVDFVMSNLSVEQLAAIALETSQSLPVTFGQQEYDLDGDGFTQSYEVLTVPRHKAPGWIEKLAANGITAEVMENSQSPAAIELVLPHLVEGNAERLEARFGQNRIPDRLSLYGQVPPDLRITPSPELAARTQSEVMQGKASLAYLLMTEQICKLLEDHQVDQIRVIGLRHNDYANQNFDRWQGLARSFSVVAMEMEPNHPQYHRYNGVPAIQVQGGGVLGVFAPESAKLPIGTQFIATVGDATRSALSLDIEPSSVRLVEPGQELESVQKSQVTVVELTGTRERGELRQPAKSRGRSRSADHEL
ncbi:MAG: hypothetical protein NW224_12690 [Leptolyngbyaceae cyanobacterium bins.302]|nr:hypothetical protein [Leptolyngbyaceae cyanobacterium bins.302]